MELEINKQKNLKVSIIIPVYNLERYIAESIRSCVDQTYRNIEVIVVNDGSTDGSESEIKPFLKDTRIKLFNQSNAGVSAARNRGIEMATGDYLTFLDGDDTLAPNTVENFVELLSKLHFDYKWLFFPIIRILPTGERVNDIGQNFMPSYKYEHEMTLSCAEAFDMIRSRKLPMCVGGVFYKSGFIGPDFITGRFEDSFMIMNVLGKDEPLFVSTQGEYRYLHREGSFINLAWTPEKWRDYVRVQLKTLDTELHLFPERKKKIERRLSAIRYNLRYLRFKNRRNANFAMPLEYFDSEVKSVVFNFYGWLTMTAKCIVSLLR